VFADSFLGLKFLKRGKARIDTNNKAIQQYEQQRNTTVKRKGFFASRGKRNSMTYLLYTFSLILELPFSVSQAGTEHGV
jgi:hypothetical protein